MVPEINKQQPAMVALAVNPAGKANCLSDVSFPQFSTGVATIGVHCLPLI